MRLLHGPITRDTAPATLTESFKRLSTNWIRYSCSSRGVSAVNDAIFWQTDPRSPDPKRMAKLLRVGHRTTTDAAYADGKHGSAQCCEVDALDTHIPQ